MLLTYDRNLIESEMMAPEMSPDEIEAALATLTDPTTAPALAEALGYQDAASITRACREDRIPNAIKIKGIYLIPIDGVRQAIENGTLSPGHKRDIAN
jgi:hypothetical protein